ncbi:MAG TPA: LLM class F420-dependent oxidoreductase [Dehalococcoidia bacterium]|nr:LLM class F420-dependent oxidoreductase [Dehalococcoidia bacterium]
MRFGFYLPTRGPQATGAAVEALASHGEALGYHSAVVADHIIIPVSSDSTYPYTLDGKHPSEGDALEQLAEIAFVAGVTRTLRLITSVLIVPHRNPVVTAKMLATIDVLSRGRLTVGVGVGWLREEFAALGAPAFDRRGAVTDEYIHIFKALWSDGPASYKGEFYQFDGVWCLPRPLQQPHPPIWIGGHSRAALRRAARLGDGWHPVGGVPSAPLRPAELAEKVAELRGLCAAEGRDAADLTISLKAPLYDVAVTGDALDSEGHERRPLSGSAEQIAADIAAYAAAGVSELILDFRGEALGASLDRMEWFAREVMTPAGS